MAHFNINGMAVFLHGSQELGVIRRLDVILDNLVLAASPNLGNKKEAAMMIINFPLLKGI